MNRIVLAVLILLTSVYIKTGAQAQQQVEFPTSSIWRGTKVTLSGELFGADGASKPAVILMHGCGGLQPSVISSLRAHARRLAKSGFAALILDSFGPRGATGGWVCSSDRRLINAVRYRTIDARDAVKYLRERGDIDMRNIFAMGQSNGGTTVLALARLGRSSGLRAVAAYYPFCSGAGGYRLPVLIFSGGQDSWTLAAPCKQQEGGRTKVIVYPDAVHSFDLPIGLQRFQGHLVGQDAGATADSRSRIVAFFRRHMVR